jgi:adenylylsulfate kinase
MLVVFAGLPGSGKSTLSSVLAAEIGAVVLDKDRVRAALFPSEAIEYSTRQDDFCVALMLQTARYLFERDAARTVILDGRPFTQRYQVEQVMDFCRLGGFLLRIVECTCPPEVAEERLQQAHLALNRGVTLYREMRAQAEPISQAHLVVDTTQPLERCIERCREYLAAESQTRNVAP